tara:strand:+ start:221 stop:427 length:207 start_codon:yes stop_codon:yes gene_type:complete
MNYDSELFESIAGIFILVFLYRYSKKKRKNWSPKKNNQSTLKTIGFVFLISIIGAFFLQLAYLSVGEI